MSWKSLPSATPRALLRRPELLAEWLQLTNRLRRFRGEHSVAQLIGLGSAVLIGAAAMVGLFARQLSAAMSLVIDYRMLSAVVAAVYAATSVASRKRQLVEAHLDSWLIATLSDSPGLRWSRLLRSVLPTIAQFVVIASIVVAFGGVNAWLAVAIIGAGLVAGAFVGALAKAAPAKSEYEGSRYVAYSKPTAFAQWPPAIHPSYAALERWPIAQVMAWSRPENSRYVLVAALLGVQGGSSAVAGLSVMAMYFLVSYLAGLISALVHVSRQAVQWLSATPITLSQFAWALSRLALIHQVLGTAAASGLVLVLGAPLSMALQVASLWLGLCISISGCAIVDRYRRRSPAVKIVIVLAAFAALIAVHQIRAAGKA